uniref:Ig-like domain-containing protein n=1 Tax=Caenorhabditis japonica TaxID=281687 RepID=A0A8R1DYW5_CAEJA
MLCTVETQRNATGCPLQPPSTLFYLTSSCPFPADQSFTIAEPLPVIYTVGEPAFLPCIGKTETRPNQSVVWTRADGELPSGSKVEQGVLHLPPVHRNDEGSYTCAIVMEVEDDSVLSTVDLQVEDFVPLFTGQPIELPPLTDDEFTNLDIEITLNSSNPKGVIFETRKINTGDLLGQPFDTIHHTAKITDHGTILYDFDVGNGRQIVETTNPINPNEWNVIKIKNDKNQVTIQLNDEAATIRQHSNPLPQLTTGTNNPVYIGGQYEPVREEDEFNVWHGSIW